MASWREVTGAAPEVAALVQQRIEATGLAILATLRRDGSPRISGIETMFRDGELYLGMMPNSRKALDLRRDPRLALHNATVDKEVKDGDVKITGRAIEVFDEPVRDAIRGEVKEQTDYDIGTEFHLFRIDVTEIATLQPEGDHLVIQSWREGEAPKRIERK